MRFDTKMTKKKKGKIDLDKAIGTENDQILEHSIHNFFDYHFFNSKTKYKLDRSAVLLTNQHAMFRINEQSSFKLNSTNWQRSKQKYCENTKYHCKIQEREDEKCLNPE